MWCHSQNRCKKMNTKKFNQHHIYKTNVTGFLFSPQHCKHSSCHIVSVEILGTISLNFMTCVVYNPFENNYGISFYTCFDWFKKLRLFVNERNLKIDVVLKVLRAIVIRWFSLNEAPLGLFKFISDYLPFFEKINIFFNIITKKVWINLKDWSKLFVQFIRNNLNQVIHTLV